VDAQTWTYAGVVVPDPGHITILAVEDDRICGRVEFTSDPSYCSIRGVFVAPIR
jgi:hypothetical protein